MAKKQAADAEPANPAEAAAETKETKPEAKEGKPAKEKKPRAPKPAPDQAPVEGAKAETPEAPKPPKAAVPSEGGKKKKRAGVAPARGKKLRNHIRNTNQRIEKEGAVSVKRAVGLLKAAKRVKFDETVEI